MGNTADNFLSTAVAVGPGKLYVDVIGSALGVGGRLLLGTDGSPDSTQNPSAKTIIAAYSAAYPGASNIGAYTFGGYDCAAIILDSIGRAIDANGGNMPSRAQVLAQVGKTANFQGLTGVISFDANGDPTHPVLQLQQVKGGAWAFVTQISQGA